MGLSLEWTDSAKPLYEELSPLVAEGRDADAAAVFNRRDRSGCVPRRHVAATLARFPAVLGLVRWVIDTRTMPAPYGGGAVDFGLYCLFAAIWLVVESDEGLKAGVAELSAGLGQLPQGLVPDEFTVELLAGEVKISRAEELLGREVSANEIGLIRNGGE